MTITTEQLDDLEAKARAESSAFIPLSIPMAPDVTLKLVAIARAALAWRAARNAYANVGLDELIRTADVGHPAAAQVTESLRRLLAVLGGEP